MEQITSADGTTVSFDRYGSGPPLVLVHGSFSDHDTNWEFVKPLLESRFTVYAVARRGRGDTDATPGRSLEDDANDVVAVLHAVDEPAFLLGHSYGAQCSLAAAALAPERVRKLVLYEAPRPDALPASDLARLDEIASRGAWEEFTVTFFRDVLAVPADELDALRTTELWAPIVADAPASLDDLRALVRYEFAAERFSSLVCPVLLQVGSESPRYVYVTDALASTLPDARIETLPGQAHEGMTTAPELYASAVVRFLLG